MKHKRFALLTILLLVCFTSVNFIVWKMGTELLLTKVSDGGDLARLAYLPQFKLPRKNNITLPKRHTLMTKPMRADILTIGDSFSLGLSEGKNYFYQDYIASNTTLSVANVWPYTIIDSKAGISPLDDIILLHNSGLLDTIKPKYILVESAERFCIQRFSKDFDFNQTVSSTALLNFYRARKYNPDYIPKFGIINNGNIKYLYYSWLYNWQSMAAYNQHELPVAVKELNKPLFSIEDSSKLLFLKDDINNISLCTTARLRKMNDNLNTVADMLARKGIKLVFMPIVDKYNLYREFMPDKTSPRSHFFEQLRPLPKKYGFIDTKHLLFDEVNKGERDIFYPDDSHWSWKAPEKIFHLPIFQ